MERRTDSASWWARSILSVAIACALLGAPERARAAQLDSTCGLAADIILFGTEALQFNVIGQTSGTAGMLANLLCFVGDRRCSCMRNITESNSGLSSDYAREVGRLLAACAVSTPGRQLSGVSQEAATNVCR